MVVQVEKAPLIKIQIIDGVKLYNSDCVDIFGDASEVASILYKALMDCMKYCDKYDIDYSLNYDNN